MKRLKIILVLLLIGSKCYSVSRPEIELSSLIDEERKIAFSRLAHERKWHSVGALGLGLGFLGQSTDSSYGDPKKSDELKTCQGIALFCFVMSISNMIKSSGEEKAASIRLHNTRRERLLEGVSGIVGTGLIYQSIDQSHYTESGKIMMNSGVALFGLYFLNYLVDGLFHSTYIKNPVIIMSYENNTVNFKIRKYI